MEDILASIRRILSEDEAPASSEMPAAPQSTAETPGDGVLVLDPAMMVPEPSAHEPSAHEPPAHEPPAHEPAGSPEVLAVMAEPPRNSPPESPLVAPETEAAAATSVGSLLRTLERTVQIRSGGPTLEDIVREEIRPMLKAWLDANLPSLVERLVSAEIERVVTRAVP
jgi:cell pole-organizing protein PopZ